MISTSKRDILIFMSDQHSPRFTGHEGGMVDTPVLDSMVREGVRFGNHYTSCPLCVPARMSMMCGKLPTAAGVTGNGHTLPEVTPTFLFPLVEAGYETVLIGRMHFQGLDLRHGFTKRLGGDMTPTRWVPDRKNILAERGELFETFSGSGALKFVGGGQSPVREYDKHIASLALDYLSQPHDKPQFILVGTFGPHFPYIGDTSLYKKYLARGWMPEDRGAAPEYVTSVPWFASHRQEADEDTALRAAAAYCALIEEMDGQIGAVRRAFCEYAARQGHEHIFGYVSDHGDMAGTHSMYGKQTFYEDSVRVPFIVTGDGVPAGMAVSGPTSLMDIGPTVCAMAGTRYTGDHVDGVDLSPVILGEGEADRERIVLSQMVDSRGGRSIWAAGDGEPEPETACYSVMARKGNWKYFHYHGFEDRAVLFDLESDPGETENVIGKYPEIASELRAAAVAAADPEEAEREHLERNRMRQWLRVYGRALGGVGPDERWRGSPKPESGWIECH